ncbi:MAG TPA: hypothetical protein VGL40_01655 [Bacillota bacterium]
MISRPLGETLLTSGGAAKVAEAKDLYKPRFDVSELGRRALS